MAPTAPHPPLHPPNSTVGEEKEEGGRRGDVEAAWPPHTRPCMKGGGGGGGGGGGRGGEDGRWRWARRVTDGVLYAIVSAGLLMLFFGVIPPRPATISCSDSSIRREPQKETISVGNLFLGSLIVPFFVMALIEYLVPPSTQTPSAITTFRAGLSRSWGYFTDLLVGILFTYFFCDLLKTVVGEARPEFWAKCRPDLTDEQCSQAYVTVTWQNCTNPYKLSEWKMADTMKSFPSGHAALSVYSAVFMIVYTHKRMWKRWSLLSSPVVQLIWVIWAVVCCQSRVWDNKHFWWDVLSGAIFGAAGGVITIHFLTNWFEREDPPLSSSPTGASLTSSSSSSSSSYIPGEEEDGGGNSTYSRNSTKRLITSGGEGGSEGELRNISSAP